MARQTKADLEMEIARLKQRVRELEEENFQLNNDVNYWVVEHDTLLDQYNTELKRTESEKYAIRDIDGFFWRMEVEGLLTDEIKEFIKHYERCEG